MSIWRVCGLYRTALLVGSRARVPCAGGGALTSRWTRWLTTTTTTTTTHDGAASHDSRRVSRAIQHHRHHSPIPSNRSSAVGNTKDRGRVPAVPAAPATSSVVDSELDEDHDDEVRIAEARDAMRRSRTAVEFSRVDEEPSAQPALSAAMQEAERTIVQHCAEGRARAARELLVSSGLAQHARGTALMIEVV